MPLIYRLKSKDTKLILWNWNIVSHKRANRENVFKNRCQIWTFDKSDAEKYGWKCNEQFYFKPEKEMARINNDTQRAFCACVDKGRCATLSAREKCMTIVADARTFLSDGVLGITASNSLFAMGKGENYEDTLEKVLVKHLYYRENINVKPIEDVGIFFEKHFEFIDNSSNKKQYFDFKKINNK